MGDRTKRGSWGAWPETELGRAGHCVKWVFAPFHESEVDGTLCCPWKGRVPHASQLGQMGYPAPRDPHTVLLHPRFRFGKEAPGFASPLTLRAPGLFSASSCHQPTLLPERPPSSPTVALLFPVVLASLSGSSVAPQIQVSWVEPLSHTLSPADCPRLLPRVWPHVLLWASTLCLPRDSLEAGDLAGHFIAWKRAHAANSFSCRHAAFLLAKPWESQRSTRVQRGAGRWR